MARSPAEGESAGRAVLFKLNQATYESETLKAFIGMNLLESFSKRRSEVWVSLQARQNVNGEKKEGKCL